MMRDRSCWLGGLALLFLVGCFGSGGPELGKVTGTVTLDKLPLADATVSLVPVEGGRTTIGITDQNGKFTIQFAAGTTGALVGEHRVTITTGSPPVIGDNGRVEDPGIPEKVPAKYNEQTQLVRTVQSGGNDFQFDLTTS